MSATASASRLRAPRRFKIVEELARVRMPALVRSGEWRSVGQAGDGGASSTVHLRSRRDVTVAGARPTGHRGGGATRGASLTKVRGGLAHCRASVGSMLKLVASACIDAPVERVWVVLSDLAAIQHWVGAIRHAYCPGQSRGAGAVRICELKQARIEETIVEWDEGRSFTYRGVGAPMMRHQPLVRRSPRRANARNHNRRSDDEGRPLWQLTGALGQARVRAARSPISRLAQVLRRAWQPISRARARLGAGAGRLLNQLAP